MRRWPDLSHPLYHDAVTAVLKRNTLTEGPEVRELEREFQRWMKTTRACVATSSGTSALEVALRVWGVGPGDEVIVPALSFTATALAVLAVGAKPVFVDVDETWNIDPKLACQAVTDRTRVVIAVDLHGSPANYAKLKEYLPTRVRILQDACPAHGSTYLGSRCGLQGDAAALSFNQTKICPAGEGGMLIIPTYLEHEAREVVCFGEDRGGEEDRESRRYGTNFKMPELTAAVARVSLQLLPVHIKWTRYVVERLLENLPLAFTAPVTVPGADVTWHKLRLGTDLPRQITEDVVECWEIPVARREVVPLHLQPALSRADFHCPVAERAMDTTFVIGSHELPLFAATRDELDRWCQAFTQSPPTPEEMKV